MGGGDTTSQRTHFFGPGAIVTFACDFGVVGTVDAVGAPVAVEDRAQIHGYRESAIRARRLVSLAFASWKCVEVLTV